jgi:Ca2+-binding EF-hand superfamily protein
MKDGDGDSWVEKKEFRALLSNLFYFNKLFQAFQALDEDNDRRLDLEEFKESCSVLGLSYSDEEAEAEFKSIDKNGGGIVLFIEFCDWYSEQNKLDEIEDENDPNDFGRVKK